MIKELIQQLSRVFGAGKESLNNKTIPVASLSRISLFLLFDYHFNLNIIIEGIIS